MNYFAFALAAVLAGPVAAQQMYRCGSTFSQQPCGPEAKVIESPGVVQPRATRADPESLGDIEAQCRSWVVSAPVWKDRESVRVIQVIRGPAEGRTVSGASRIVHLYYALTSYGGYSGVKTLICYADESTGQVVDLSMPGL